MNDSQPPTDRAIESIACDICGRFGAVEIGDRHVCMDCYGGCGSCCPEFGRKESTSDQVTDGANKAADLD
jgi:hypothetical protein